MEVEQEQALLLKVANLEAGHAELIEQLNQASFAQMAANKTIAALSEHVAVMQTGVSGVLGVVDQLKVMFIDNPGFHPAVTTQQEQITNE